VDTRAEKWLRYNQELIRGYETRLGEQDLGYAANGTTLEVDPQDVWGASYPRLRRVKVRKHGVESKNKVTTSLTSDTQGEIRSRLRFPQVSPY
jgi:hypothetical protein